MISLFGITYLCEQMFSRVKNVKSKTRTRITKTHLENSPRIASYQIKADIESNKVIHAELKVPTVRKEITKFSVKYRDKITTHINKLTSPLLEEDEPRRLRRFKPTDLTTRFT
jgi:hypothetical protein